MNLQVDGLSALGLLAAAIDGHTPSPGVPSKYVCHCGIVAWNGDTHPDRHFVEIDGRREWRCRKHRDRKAK